MNATELPKRLRALRDSMLAGLIERDTPIRLALLAALTGEHLLLVGPPGTAKSELARRLRFAFHDASYFERLLTRFSTPEELFGPLSIKALEQDRYERRTEHYLPEASVAFLDEIFKANSAILNSLLTLLNEREFDNGKERKKTPLICVVAASNELPDGEELAALYDRFLLRYQVKPVSGDGFTQLLDLRGAGGFQAPSDALRLRREDLVQIQSEAEQVRLPDDVKALLVEFRRFLAEQKIAVSDRRWRKIVKLLQTSALTNGRQEISIWDCWLLQHCVWEKPGQFPDVEKWFFQRIGADRATVSGRLERLVSSLEEVLANEGPTRSGEEELLRRIEQRIREIKGEDQPSELPGYGLVARMMSEQSVRLELLLPKFRDAKADRRALRKELLDVLGLEDVPTPRSYPRQHVQARCSECREHLELVRSHRLGTETQLAALANTLTSHLWIDVGLFTDATHHLEQCRQTFSELEDRLKRVLAGFSELPVLVEE